MMKPRVSIATVGLVVRVVLGCWFVYSGGLKIFGTGLDRFTTDITNYGMVRQPLDAWIAYSLPWAELFGGVCLMLGLLRKGAILVIAGLVAVFSIAIGWAWFHQLDISCGCHGSDAKIRYWTKAFELAGYFAVLGWLWWLETTGSNRREDVASPS